MSTNSLNRCCSCSCCGVLRCSPLRRPSSSTATTVSGDGEADGVCGGNGLGCAGLSYNTPPGLPLSLCSSCVAAGGWSRRALMSGRWLWGGSLSMVAPAQPERHGLVTEAEGGPWHVDTCSPVGQQVQANNALISDVGEPELVTRLARPHHHRQQLLPRHYCPFTRDGEQFGIGGGSSSLEEDRPFLTTVLFVASKWWTPYPPGRCRAARQPHSPGTVLW